MKSVNERKGFYHTKLHRLHSPSLAFYNNCKIILFTAFAVKGSLSWNLSAVWVVRHTDSHFTSRPQTQEDTQTNAKHVSTTQKGHKMGMKCSNPMHKCACVYMKSDKEDAPRSFCMHLPKPWWEYTLKKFGDIQILISNKK